MRLPGCRCIICSNKLMKSALAIHLLPLKSKPFFRMVIRGPKPCPNNWFYLFMILALSRPATPNNPMFIRLCPSKDRTRLLSDNHNGKPESTSRRILPRDQTSNMKDTWAKSCTRTFVCYVKRLERKEWISGGKYSGVLCTNSHWFRIVRPSSFSKKEEPRSITLRLLMDWVSGS